MNERSFDTSGRYMLNCTVFTELMYKHDLDVLPPSIKKRIKNLVRDYCSEDLTETLIAINTMKRVP